MYHSFFLYSSVNRHLGCFHVLAIVLQGTLGFMCLFELWFSQGVLGEGNGTLLQYCCLENPMDGGAW